MSRGPGRVQSAIIFAFEQDPAARFTARDLAEIAFADKQITPSHVSAVTRALKSPALQRRLALSSFRSGRLRTGGWQLVYGRAS